MLRESALVRSFVDTRWIPLQDERDGDKVSEIPVVFRIRNGFKSVEGSFFR